MRLVSTLLRGANVRRFRTLAALASFKLNLLAFLKAAIAIHVDVGVMDEKILTTVVGGDETKALLVVEPLHGTCTQNTVSLGPLEESFTLSSVLRERRFPKGFKPVRAQKPRQ